jgi:hypothetical protein
MLADLCGVLGAGVDEEGEEGGVGGGVGGDGKERGAREVLRGGEDVMGCADGEVSWAGRGEVGGLLRGVAARGDEAELVFKIDFGDWFGGDEGIHVHAFRVEFGGFWIC